MIPALPRDESSFFDDRWEQDRIRHFYYLGTPAYKRMVEVSKHIVLKGHRGTGKTTLLRALDWRERVSNPHLRDVLHGQPFSDRILGCFLQIKFLPVTQIDTWLAGSTRSSQQQVISAYLRASWLYEACDAVINLEDELGLPSYGRQLEILEPLTAAFWDWVNERQLGISKQDSSGIVSARTIQNMATGVMRAVRDAAAIGSPTPERIIAKLDLSAFAPLCSEIFSKLISIVRESDGDDRWIFRICMDEGEFLTSEWAVAVRSLIRQTDFPVYLAVSVLGALGGAESLERAQVSIDDREIVDLDDRSTSDMLALVNGIVNARLSEFGVDAGVFDASRFFGDFDIDELLVYAISRSETPVSDRVTTVRHFVESVNNGGETSEVDEWTRADRFIDSTIYRKQKTAAYLRLLAELGIANPTYAGWRVCILMADNSVRDFMRLLRYSKDDWSNRSRRKDRSLKAFFGQSAISIGIQNRALLELGQKKLESVPIYIVDATEAQSIITLFGSFARSIDYSKDADLRRPNATRIVLSVPAALKGTLSMKSSADLYKLLEQCVDYGYLADLKRDSPHQFSFRMNRSLARLFGFSFWKPQYRTRLNWRYVERALIETGKPTVSWFSKTSIRASAVRKESELDFDWDDLV